MRLVALEQLHPGDRLGKDVQLGPSATPLLREGVRLSRYYIDGLRRAGIQGVYVDDELSVGIEPVEPLRQETRRSAAVALAAAFDTASTGGASAAVANETILSLKNVAGLIADEIALSRDAAVAISDLASVDNYTLQHSLDTTAIGVLIADRHFTRHGWVDWNGQRRFDRIKDWLVLLGTGLLLHDIGKLAVPPEILHKTGPLDQAEWAVMREHPTIGYAMVVESEALSPLVKAVIKSHHERWDGSGYPRGTAGERIPPFARLAAIADVFDAMTGTRPYKEAAPIHEGWGAIVSGAGTQFDPEFVDTFRRTIAPFPVGTTVTLSDGRSGIVASTPLGAVDRPVVRIVLGSDGGAVDSVEVALAQDDAPTIVRVDVPLDAALAREAARAARNAARV